eukprot:gene3567-biopygen17235
MERAGSANVKKRHFWPGTTPQNRQRLVPPCARQPPCRAVSNLTFPTAIPYPMYGTLAWRGIPLTADPRGAAQRRECFVKKNIRQKKYCIAQRGAAAAAARRTLPAARHSPHPAMAKGGERRPALRGRQRRRAAGGALCRAVHCCAALRSVVTQRSGAMQRGSVRCSAGRCSAA